LEIKVSRDGILMHDMYENNANEVNESNVMAF